jgi:hypothetical protein
MPGKVGFSFSSSAEVDDGDHSFFNYSFSFFVFRLYDAEIAPDVRRGAEENWLKR